MNFVYPIVSVIIVSLVSIFAALPLLIKKKVSEKTLLFLLSISVGVLLSTVFLDFLPEIFEHHYDANIAFYILLGFMIMFLLEKLIHCHHNKKCEEANCGHGHAYHLAPVNLLGDGIHNFIDGLVIAGTYAVDIGLGIATTISVIFHEIPQEVADFGVLLYSGMSKKKALVFNFLSSLTAIIGAVVGILLSGKMHDFNVFIIPFAAGNFIYIAASNLLPELHKRCGLKDSFLHILAIFIGIGIIVLVTMYAPAHAHG